MAGSLIACWMFMALISATDAPDGNPQADPIPSFVAHRVGSYRGEACCVGDFNNDGKTDIVALPYLYCAPNFDPTVICQVAGDVDENGKGYRDDFMNVAIDVDRDGWLDVVTCSWFAQSLEWLRNPGPTAGTWEKSLIERNGNFESGELCDIDGDGKALEILPTIAATVWYELSPVSEGKPGMIKHVISETGMTWGVGHGDVNGDGRTDILRPDAWFEAPSDPRTGPWKEHPLSIGRAKDGTKRDTAHILVLDVNRDGLADLITGSAHDYGVFWYEQSRQGAEVSWKEHLIDDSWSQAHSLALADMDGDKDMELLCGKRFMAHNGSDPGEAEPLGVYCYDMTAGPNPTWTKRVITYDQGIGSGMNICVIDLDRDGDLDIVVTGKWGGPVWFENGLKKPQGQG